MRRRTVLGMGVALAAPAAPAWAHLHGAGPFFDVAPLATNALAQTFTGLPPDIRAPSTILATEHGPKRFSDLRGKVRIVCLWNEADWKWSEELHDLATLNAREADARFEVVAILTASPGKLTLAEARAMLAAQKVGDLPLWVEGDGGGAIAAALGVPTESSVLLVDPLGRPRAMSRGVSVTGRYEAETPGGRIVKIETTDWGTPDAAQLAAQLKAGALA